MGFFLAFEDQASCHQEQDISSARDQHVSSLKPPERLLSGYLCHDTPLLHGSEDVALADVMPATTCIAMPTSFCIPPSYLLTHGLERVAGSLATALVPYHEGWALRPCWLTSRVLLCDNNFQHRRRLFVVLRLSLARLSPAREVAVSSCGRCCRSFLLDASDHLFGLAMYGFDTDRAYS
jgi:hypothetical protein